MFAGPEWYFAEGKLGCSSIMKADSRRAVCTVRRLHEKVWGSVQARFLLARLNPSSTYSTQTSMSAEMIMTDDVSLSVFMDHLRKLATSG